MPSSIVLTEVLLRNQLVQTLGIACLLAMPICTVAQSTQTQPPTQKLPMKQEELFKTIADLDHKVFDAIDRCDMQAEASFWSDDAEFYHDKDGLSVGGKQIVEDIKNNLCGKVKRELVPGTLEVFPLGDYGAVEMGVHRFLHPYQQDHGEIGEARFIHVWQLKDGHWKITRVISVDHHEAK
jgi:ketosteroid isomerase-like protein